MCFAIIFEMIRLQRLIMFDFAGLNQQVMGHFVLAIARGHGLYRDFDESVSHTQCAEQIYSQCVYVP